MFKTLLIIIILFFNNLFGANAQNTVNVSDVLKIVAASPFITLGGGTIKDTGTTTDSDLNVGAAIATATGTLTVAA